MENTSANRRYLLHEQLGKGGMGAVFRATDRLTGETVAYKQVLTQQHLGPQSQETDASIQQLRIALAREFEVLATLKHPYVISVLDYGFDDERRPYFTMSLLQNARTLLDAGRDQSLKVKINLLVHFLQALSYLHRRHVVHCDLKPDNVLVTQDGAVQVVDFGLATLQTQARADSDEVSGTLTYIAPEVLQGKPNSFAADMYAFGVMAYEMFVGRHPFGDVDVSNLITAVLFQQPDFAAVKAIDWAAEIAAVNGRELATIDANTVADDLVALMKALLVKTSEERISNADEVIERLVSATHMAAPQETMEIRESFLQAARFIGRESEMERLAIALDAALHGTGGNWLLAGESGVGKSRIVNELRTIALVRGMLVLRGQEVQTGGQAYAVWTNILQHLVLNVTVNDLEASILKPVVPNISDLLNKDVADPPALEPQQVKERLIGTVASLFRRLNKPAIVFLEDLHWTTGSLDLLQRLNTLVAEMPVMIVGTFRSDERPDLGNELPQMTQMKLERLSREHVEELAVSMMGESGRNPGLLDFLQKETEGNTFFLVEVVRSLAEAAGRLSKVATMQLPAAVFAGGIQTIIQNRLAHVPEAMRPLLDMAAIMGRQLDLSVLRRVAQTAQPTIDVDDWLTTCVNVAVLDKQDEDWRFAHDKVRDGLLTVMKPKHAASLHQQAAQTIEAVHNPREKAPALAYHWGAAGNTAKEKDYSAIAGEQALHTSSYADAKRYLQRVVQLEADPDRLSMVQYQIGEAYRALSTYDEAMKHYEQARDLQGQGSYLALLGLGHAHLDKGEHETSIPHFQKSLEAARRASDRVNESYALYGLSRAEWYRGNLEEANQLAQQALDAANAIGHQRGKSLALYTLGMVNLQTGKLQEGRDLLSQAYQIDREIGNRRGEAFSRMYVGVSHFLEGQYRKGLPFVMDAQSIARDIGERRLESLTLVNIGQAYHHLGEHDKNIELGERAVSIFREIGDQRFEALSMSNVGQSLLLTGQFDRAAEFSQKALELSTRIDFPASAGVALNNLGQLLFLQENVDEALQYLEKAETLGIDHEQADILRRCYGHMAEVYIHKCAFETALGKAEAGLQHEGDEDTALAPLMKATALLLLQRGEAAKTYIEEVIASLQSELEQSSEKYALHYAMAYAKSLQLLLASPSEIATLMTVGADLYRKAIALCPHDGVIRAELRRLAFIEPLDTMGALAQVRALLENAKK